VNIICEYLETVKEPLNKETTILKNTMTAVSYNRWVEAQNQEFVEYTDHDIPRRRRGKGIIFRYLGINFEEGWDNKTIVEVAAGSTPTLGFIEGNATKIAIEPLMARWDNHRASAEVQGITIITDPYEHVDIKGTYGTVDETWFFNCLQHVIDPKAQLEKAKATSKIIRVFEPLGGTVNLAHPHVISRNTFTEVLGDFGQIFKGGTEEGFHSFDCYYGTWRRED